MDVAGYCPPAVYKNPLFGITIKNNRNFYSDFLVNYIQF